MGKLRSTPSPPTILRTVNSSRVPLPRRAMTTPLKIWIRSLSPSRMRVWTFTVSPIENSSGSARRLEASTCFMMAVFLTGIMTISFRQCRIISPPTRPVGSYRKSSIFAGRLPGALQQVATHQPGAIAAGRFAPGGDLGMVSFNQHVRNLHSAVFARTRVLRIFQEPRLGKRFVLAARLIPEHPGNEAYHGVDDHHRRHLASVGDEIAHGNFERGQSLPDPLVKAVVSAAQEHQPRRCSQLMDQLLVEASSLGREHDEPSGCGRGFLDGFDAVEDRLAAEQHSRPPAVSFVIHRLM